jgi:hypothetical protein
MMTEGEWLSSSDPQEMLLTLRGRIGARKLRLFACACCRRAWHLIPTQAHRAVEAAERYADGLADAEELYLARMAAENAAEDAVATAVEAAQEAAASAAFSVLNALRNDGEQAAEYSAANVASAIYHVTSAISESVIDDPFIAASEPAAKARAVEQSEQAEILREIVGNPFRVIAALPHVLFWNDGTIPKLAEGIYTDRAFDRLPILADALEDAGCDSANILAHCRGPGPHVRGCWVVDLLLGKE